MHKVTYQRYFCKPKNFQPARLRQTTQAYEAEHNGKLYQPPRLYSDKLKIPSHSRADKNNYSYDFIKQDLSASVSPAPRTKAKMTDKNIKSEIDEDSRMLLNGISGKRFGHDLNAFRPSTASGLEKKVRNKIKAKRLKISNVRGSLKKQEHLAGSISLYGMTEQEMNHEREKSQKPQQKRDKVSQIFYSGNMSKALSAGVQKEPKCLLKLETPTTRPVESVSRSLSKSPYIRKAAFGGQQRSIYGKQVVYMG